MFLCDHRKALIYLLSLAALTCACVNSAQVKPTEDKFYKSPYVRRCLQYDKEKMVSQSQACWARLLKKTQQDPKFVEKAELSDADIAKIRENAHRSDDQSIKLKKELDACMKLPSHKRDERIKCYKDYQSKHGDQLSRAQKFEIENTIATLNKAKVRASGAIEATIEHAAKLLGLQFHEEKQGIRIDAITGEPGKQTAVKEQGLIVAIDGTKVVELDSAERIARLETCEDKPIVLLVRYGGIGDITFGRVEAKCGKQPAGKKLWEVILPPETCSEANSPEISLGISWCYISKDGLLEVEEVCADSPAAKAGVLPGHKYHSINGTFLLGKTYLQIGQYFKEYPKTPIEFREVGGTLQSPSALKSAPLDPKARKKCWSAIESTLDRGDVPGNK
jgi:C-terminal processing protease CtpA/Prc